MLINHFQHDTLQIEHFVTEPGQAWCLYGSNSSGIDAFISLLAGDLKGFQAAVLELPDHLGLLSFSTQQNTFEDELRNDDTDFMDYPDPGTLVREFIPEWQNHRELLKIFNLDRFLETGYRYLSSGQCRKVHLIREITGGATTIVIQNPYDGLDAAGRQDLDLIFQQLIKHKVTLLLIVSSTIDIPTWHSHLAIFAHGRLAASGKREIVEPVLTQLTASDNREHELLFEFFTQRENPREAEPIVRLVNGHANYGELTLFSGLDLEIHDGDHTLVTGPNGCGKSTLLEMIIGDNQKCYTNELWLFGMKRGSGESIWDIKKQMGIVSPALHRGYRAAGTALQVILSGLYDTIGLYKKVNPPEIRLANQWLDWLSLRPKANRSFRTFTFAEQRLLLICRALIKKPRLLVLDEPSHGLDDFHRKALLELLENVADRKISTILFVSHREDEWRPFFRKHLQLASFAPGKE